MAVTAALSTYGDVSRKEDVVLNAMEILTAKENQIFNMLEKTTAIDTIHHFLVDSLKAAASNAQVEAADYTFLTRTTPTRLTNLVQHIAVPFRLSRTQVEVGHYHGQNEKQRQLQKALTEWANDAEFVLVRETLTSGLSGTAPKMAGIIQAISKSTNTTAHTSAVQWSASVLDGLMKANWDNSNGDVATDLFVGSKLRADTDSFVQKSNVVVNAPGVTHIVRTVTTYETAFGTLRIYTHRYIQQSADATARVLAIRPEKLKVAFLNKPYIDTGLSRGGDYDPLAVTGKFTLETRNQDSNWFASGFIK
jgi:hypothetical protein